MKSEAKFGGKIIDNSRWERTRIIFSLVHMVWFWNREDNSSRPRSLFKHTPAPLTLPTICPHLSLPRNGHMYVVWKAYWVKSSLRSSPHSDTLFLSFRSRALIYKPWRKTASYGSFRWREMPHFLWHAIQWQPSEIDLLGQIGLWRWRQPLPLAPDPCFRELAARFVGCIRD